MGVVPPEIFSREGADIRAEHAARGERVKLLQSLELRPRFDDTVGLEARNRRMTFMESVRSEKISDTNSKHA